jgi:protein SCO1
MRPPHSLSTVVVFLLILPGALGARLARAGAVENLVQEVRFDQNLDAQVPLDLSFRDEEGRTVKLGDYLGSKPLILTLNYYNCPMLCTVELNALLRSLQPLPFDMGKEFQIVTVSINPAETPRLAGAKKVTYIRRYNRPGARDGWHFLTGEAPAIKQLADAVGFHYAYDAQTQQFAHPAGFVVLTPSGKIARYFYGVEYPPRDVRFALLEASEGRIGSPVDQILLYCFHYDPRTGKYNFMVMSVIRVLGVATAGGLAGFMLVMFRRDRQKAALGGPAQEDASTALV